MGSSTSKVSRAVNATAARHSSPASSSNTSLPPHTAVPPASVASPQSHSDIHARMTPPPRTSRPQPRVSTTRNAAVDLDSSDPDFAQSLRSIGPVQPIPTLSPSFAPGTEKMRNNHTGFAQRSNPAIAVLEARSRLQRLAETEFARGGRSGHEGREFLDIHTIRQMLIMRDEQRHQAEDIERRLGLKSGAMNKLGKAGVAELIQETGRADKEVRMV